MLYYLHRYIVVDILADSNNMEAGIWDPFRMARGKLG